MPQNDKPQDDAAGAEMDYEKVLADLQMIGSMLESTGDDKEAQGPPEITLNFELGKVLELLPDEFIANPDAEYDKALTISIVVENLYEQLAKGKVAVSVAKLAYDVPAEIISSEALVEEVTEISLPLPMVVAALDPDSLAKRTAPTESKYDVSALPDPFRDMKTPDEVADEKARESGEAPTEEPAEAEPEAAEPVVEAEPEAPAPVEEPEPAAEEIAPPEEEPVVEVAPPAPEPEPEPVVAEITPPEEEPSVQAPPAPEPEPEPEPVVEVAVAAPPPLPPEPVVEEPAVAAPPPLPPEPVVEEAPPAPEPEPEPVGAEIAPPEEEPSVQAPPIAIQPVVEEVAPVAIEPVVEEIVPPLPPPEPVVEEAVPEPEPVAPPAPVAVVPAVAAAAAVVATEEPIVPVAAPAEPTPVPVAPAAEVAPAAPVMETPGEWEDLERLGGVNLNSAVISQLMTLDGVTDMVAKSIIDYREKNGPFKSIFDVGAVPRVGRKTFKKITGMPFSETHHHRLLKLPKVLGLPKESIGKLPDIVEALVSKPGILSCVVSDAQGLPVARSKDDEMGAKIGAVAPRLMMQIRENAEVLKISEVSSVSMCAGKSMFTISAVGEVYLTVVHKDRKLTKAQFDVMLKVTEELAWLLGHRGYVGH